MRGAPATRDDDDYVKTDIKDRIDTDYTKHLCCHIQIKPAMFTSSGRIQSLGQ